MNAKPHLKLTEAAQFARPLRVLKLCATATDTITTSRKKESGRIPMKQWRLEEAARLGVSEGCIGGRLYRLKQYPHLRIERVNKRVVFVVQ